MATLLGADVITETLAQEGIHQVFTLPGGQMLPIYYSMKQHPDMDITFCRHEGAAALMAAGYSFASGGPSCVMATVGAGIAYEVGSLVFALNERLPVLSLSPQVQSYKMKPIQENLQACDQDDIFKPLTKFNAILYHRDRIPNLIRRALKIALSPERGPVHLDTPVDVIFGFERVSRRKRKELFPKSHFRFSGEMIPSEEAVKRAVVLIASARRPLILVGRNVDRARAGEDLARLAQELSIPVIPSAAAYSSIAQGDLHMGTARLWHETGISRLSKADLLILIEADEEAARLARYIVNENKNIKVIQTAELSASIGSLVPVDCGLWGSPGAVLRTLAEEIQNRVEEDSSDSNWLSSLVKERDRIKFDFLGKFQGDGRIEALEAVVDIINRTAGPEDMVICEGETVAPISLALLQRSGLHNTLALTDNYVPGAGYPVALGMKRARNEKNIFLITGSGQFKRHMRELQTACRYGLAISIFIIQESEKKPDEEVDFTAFANSLGVAAVLSVESVKEISEKLVTDSMKEPTGSIFDLSHIGTVRVASKAV